MYLSRLVEDILGSSNGNAAAAHLDFLQGHDGNGGPGTEVSNPVEEGAALGPLLIHIPGEAQHLQVGAPHQGPRLTVKGGPAHTQLHQFNPGSPTTGGGARGPELGG